MCVLSVRAIHPVTNTALYFNSPDKNRSSLELGKQWDGEVQNYKFKYVSSVCENDSPNVGNLGQVSLLELQRTGPPILSTKRACTFLKKAEHTAN